MYKKKIQKISDYIFIKGSSVRSDGALVFGTRFDQPVYLAADLFHAGLIGFILFSGGINKRTHENEAQRMKKLSLELGVAAADILVEDRASNTLENVLYSRDLLDRKFGLANINSLTAITKQYHMRRALMTLNKHFPAHIKIYPCPYLPYDFDQESWPETELGRTKVLGELERIERYLKKGDIAELNGINTP